MLADSTSHSGRFDRPRRNSAGVDFGGREAAGGWRICGLHSEKESIFQIYANGSKNREKWLGKSDNRAIYLRGHALDSAPGYAEGGNMK